MNKILKDLEATDFTRYADVKRVMSKLYGEAYFSKDKGHLKQILFMIATAESFLSINRKQSYHKDYSLDEDRFHKQICTFISDCRRMVG